MKHLITYLTLFFTFFISAFSQESVRPIKDVEIVRKVAIMDIEGKNYDNVEVTIKCKSPWTALTFTSKVKVTIKDDKGKKVWKKSLDNTYLYVYSNGQIRVGKRDFIQILIDKSPDSDDFLGKIRIKEGIYFD